MIVHLASDVSKVTWHKKGDYFASFMIGGNNVMIHRMSRRTSQLIFRDQKFPIQSVMFHPYRPFMLICTRTCVYLYDLNKQSLIKKLSSGNQTLSCMAVHPGGNLLSNSFYAGMCVLLDPSTFHATGDNLIIGTDLGRLAWFDLDLATSPYKVMATHASAVKGVAFHAKLPLFASVSDDATTQVFHGMVHAELDQNTLIVPLKILRYTSESNCDGVFDCVFHPTQPWLFTAGADRSILLVCDDN